MTQLMTPEFRPEFSINDYAAQAQEFKRQSLVQMDNIVFGEEEAKLAVLVAMATQGNLILTGPPGGSKTNMAELSVGLIGDMTMDDLSVVPAESDLTPTRLQGGLVETAKSVLYGDEEREEIIKAVIGGIIKPNSKVISLDEINRMNPFAINAILPALASRKLVTSAGVTPLDDLIYTSSTMNPSEARQGTFPISSANASRFSVGSVMGVASNMPEVERKTTIRRLGQNHKPSYDDINPVIDSNGIREIQKAVEMVVLPEDSDAERKFVDIVIKATDELREHDYDEADGRFAIQVAANARAIALLDGKTAVDVESMERSGKYVISARLGSISIDAYKDIPEVTAIALAD